MSAKLIHIVVSASLIAGVAGCATPSGQGAALGAGGGALIGGLAGGGTGALIGAGVGGLLGYGAGRVVEERDNQRVAMALEQDRAQSWTNPDTGNSYQVVPQQTFYQGGRECRNFRMMAEVNGRPDNVNGVACRNANGAWEVQPG